MPDFRIQIETTFEQVDEALKANAIWKEAQALDRVVAFEDHIKAMALSHEQKQTRQNLRRERLVREAFREYLRKQQAAREITHEMPYCEFVKKNRRHAAYVDMVAL